jgi:hypothetical protein
VRKQNFGNHDFMVFMVIVFIVVIYGGIVVIMGIVFLGSYKITIVCKNYPNF